MTFARRWWNVVLAFLLAALSWFAASYWANSSERQMSRQREEWIQKRNAAVLAESKRDAHPVLQSQVVTRVRRQELETVTPGYRLSIALKPGVRFDPSGLTEYGKGYSLPFRDKARDLHLWLSLDSQPRSLDSGRCSEALQREDTVDRRFLLTLRREFKTGSLECDDQQKSYDLRFYRALQDGSELWLECGGMAPFGTPVGLSLANELQAACESVKVTRVKK